MAAGFERHVGRRPTCRFARGAQRVDFGVGLAGALVPAVADDAPVADQHAADARIRVGGVAAERGELERACHQRLFAGIESAHHCETPALLVARA